jgi:DNA-binding CsgD family transcriptional regulator
MKGQAAVLSSRQAEILNLVYQGKRNKEIAYLLGLSERTIKWYLSQLFLIYGVSNRTELAGIASAESK